MKTTNINADMSHQNGLVYKIGMLLNSLKGNGIVPTLKKIKQQIYLKIKGLDFKTQNIYDLTRIGEYQNHGTALVSTSKDYLTQLISDLETTLSKEISKKVFLDYGSGKGAAIIHAKEIGFKQSIGVEFAKELHEIAVENINKMNLKGGVNSLYADATTYVPPSDTSVIYFYNPFDEVVMKKVVQNLIEQKENFENDVYVIYVNSSCEVLKHNFSLLNQINYPSGSRVDFYKL